MLVSDFLGLGYHSLGSQSTADTSIHSIEHTAAQLTEGVMEAVWPHMVTMTNSTAMVLGEDPTSGAVARDTPRRRGGVETTTGAPLTVKPFELGPTTVF
jgi:hypothetical protein